MNSRQPLVKAELATLYYDEKRSMKQIAVHYGCSLHKVAYWMNKFGLKRRSRSDATYIHLNPQGDPFQIKMPKTPEEWKLFGVGIGLYMGEGSKNRRWEVCLSNSNPGIHRTFLLFLEKFCGVSRAQVSAELNIFDDCDVEEAIQWWADNLGLTLTQFYKPTVRKSRGGSYKNKSWYGTLKIRFGNVKLKEIILGWCSEYY